MVANIKKLFSYDRYPKGRSVRRLEVEIKCVNCKTTQMLYNKSGNGPIDKIFFDSMLDNVQLKKNKELICSGCEKKLGVRFVWGPEKKSAFRMYPGSIYYKVIKKPKVVRVVR
jgi:hypothetical protein